MSVYSVFAIYEKETNRYRQKEILSHDETFRREGTRRPHTFTLQSSLHEVTAEREDGCQKTITACPASSVIMNVYSKALRR